VLDLAEGNPLFVEQMLAMLQTGGVEVADIPPTIDALLAARLDQLPGDKRSVVESASIEGRVFHRSAVATLLPNRAPALVDENLLHLVRRELIDPSAAQFAGERAFSFGHALICDAAYRAIPKRTRAFQHEQFASWLQAKAADPLGEFEEILAHHLARAVTFARDLGVEDEHTAELAERAAHHYRRVADRALARGDVRAGADMLAQVTTLLPPGDPRVPVVFALRGLAVELLDPREAQAWAEEAIQRCPPGTDASVRGFAELVGDWSSYHGDPTIDATGFNHRARALGEAAELAGETEVAAWVWLLAAHYTTTFLQRPAEATADLKRAVVLLPAVDRRWLEDKADVLRMFCSLWGPGRIPDLLAETVASPQAPAATVGVYLRYTSTLYAHQGDAAAALRALDEFRDILEKVGRPKEMTFLVEWQRYVYDLLGQPALAIGPYRRALERTLEQRLTGFASSISGGLARAPLMDGRVPGGARGSRTMPNPNRTRRRHLGDLLASGQSPRTRSPRRTRRFDPARRGGRRPRHVHRGTVMPVRNLDRCGWRLSDRGRRTQGPQASDPSARRKHRPRC
jgi:tetratricopeptide (TPR) repeat protein